MRYDPADAFIAGLLFGPLRALVGIVTMVGALVICLLVGQGYPGEWGFGPLGAGQMLVLFLIGFFSWGTLDAWVVLGFICFIGQWGALYAFVVTENAKVWWFVLFTLSMACYFPLALTGPYWVIPAGYLVLSLVYWGVPIMLSRERSLQNASSD